MRILILLLLSTLLWACDQKGSLESTRERAQAEEVAGQDVANEKLTEKAMKMESDLSERHHYFSALVGEFQGNVKVDKETYRVKFTISKSLPAYTGERVRQLSEIENDLINLYLNVQVVQWHPRDPATAVGCRIGQIKPNADKGTITIASPDCPNLYSIYLADGNALVSDKKEKRAEVIAQKIKAKEINAVTGLVGGIQPSSNARIYSFGAKRTE